MPPGRRRKHGFNRRTLLLCVAVLAVAGVAGWLFWSSLSGPGPEVWNTLFGTGFGTSDSTQYGEYIDVEVNVGGETSGSWTGSYTGSAQSQVYTVDGTYYSQEKISISLSITITYSKVSNVKIVSAYIKAVDTADSSSFNPISVSNFDWEGNGLSSGQSKSWSYGPKYIGDFLSSASASTSDATIDFKIYVKVQGTGTVSGETLTAEITEQKFQTNHFVLETQQTTAEATPSVTYASWVAGWGAIATGAVLLIIGVIVGYVLAKTGTVEVRVQRPRGRRR